MIVKELMKLGLAVFISFWMVLGCGCSPRQVDEPQTLPAKPAYEDVEKHRYVIGVMAGGGASFGNPMMMQMLTDLIAAKAESGWELHELTCNGPDLLLVFRMDIDEYNARFPDDDYEPEDGEDEPDESEDF